MILADESIPSEITKSLRKEGFEVTSIYETARGTKDDTIGILYKEEYILNDVHNILEEFLTTKGVGKRMDEQLDIEMLYNLRAELEKDIVS